MSAELAFKSAPDFESPAGREDEDNLYKVTVTGRAAPST